MIINSLLYITPSVSLFTLSLIELIITEDYSEGLSDDQVTEPKKKVVQVRVHNLKAS